MCVLSFDTCPPSHPNTEDGACKNRLIENLEQFIANTESPQPTEEVEPVQDLLADSLGVG